MDLFDLPYDLVSVKVFNDSSIVLFFALSFLLLAVVHIYRGTAQSDSDTLSV